MEKISVIIPVYNVEKFLRRCLDSVINQTYKNLEIICVNDGSKDNSLAILEEYASKDERVIIINQENQKIGAARNSGLKIATGEYITYVDSDDWIDLNYLEKLIKAIKRTNSDCAMSEIIKDKANGKKYYFLKNKKEIIKRNLKYSINELTVKGKWFIVWGKLYKKSLIDKVFFEEGIFYEDPEYLIKVSKNIDSIVKIKGSAYHYFENFSSTIRGEKTTSKREDQIESSLKVHRFALNNDIILKPAPIRKEKGKFITIKHFIDKKVYSLWGIKFLSVKKNYPLSKKVLILANENLKNCNLLVLNLKEIYSSLELFFVKNEKELKSLEKDEFDYLFVIDNVADYKKIKTRYVFESKNPQNEEENLRLGKKITNKKLNFQFQDMKLDKEENLHIAFAVDDNYAQHLASTIASILINKLPNEKINFYIITDGLKKENIEKLTALKEIAPCEIEIVKINKEEFKNCPLFKSCPHISIATYYRFVLADILNLDKVLYLDCDLTIMGSLNKLWQTNLKDCYFAGVEDFNSRTICERLNLQKYYNAGVMLINLKKWRDENIKEKLFNYTIENSEKLVYQDQDVINCTMKDKIISIDLIWNMQVGKKGGKIPLNVNYAKIYHHVGALKPWCFKYIEKYKKPYLESLKYTKWKNKVYLYSLFSFFALFLKLRKNLVRFRWSKKEKRIELFGKVILDSKCQK